MAFKKKMNIKMKQIYAVEPLKWVLDKDKNKEKYLTFTRRNPSTTI